MNQAFADTLTARLTELTGGLTYYHKPSDVMIAPKIISLGLLPEAGMVDEAEDFPRVRWLIMEGVFARLGNAPFSVRLDCGVYGRTIEEGNAAIWELTKACGGIVKKPWFSPYKLRNEVRFAMGEPGHDDNFRGVQPHPYYVSRLFLDFTVAKYSATEE